LILSSSLCRQLGFAAPIGGLIVRSDTDPLRLNVTLTIRRASFTERLSFTMNIGEQS